MASIFVLTDEEVKFMELAADPDYSVEDLADTIEIIEANMREKFESYGKRIKNLENQARDIRDEEKRLAEKRKHIESTIEQTKKRLLKAMVDTGRSKETTDLFTFSTRKSQQVIVDDMDKVPFEYLTVKDPEPNKEEIKKYLKDHAECEWAHMQDNISLMMK